MKVPLIEVKVVDSYVRTGEPVKQGDLLFSLESPTVNKNLWLTLDEISNTKKQILALQQEKKALLRILKNDHPKTLNSSLDTKMKSAIENEMQDIRKSFNEKEQALKYQLDDLREDEKYWRSLKESLIILAPKDGKISHLKVKKGDYLEAETVIAQLIPK
ncbi:efflux RND transporter periplasmic adaptor subunit [Persicobacter sp. CCB-QB2]|uniref:efflux RND transporter periplasmic adaptor subunit n=1 Tax=Persicobacter sp. CCB-QB2 TaxID=1561025 RepID=UPI000761F85F|nr:efflux RND transporter periplasmic adaptor subunit [Persicobacter sp. CCB-QB2]